MPSEFFQKFYSKVKKEYKIAFVLTFIFTFFTHLFIFTNRIPNHDSLHSFYHNQAILWSGRFTLGPIASISSYFDLPWVIGILSMLYLAFLVILIVALFNIKNNLAIFFISGLVSSFPVLGATFTYLYTADAYILGYVLALLAIYCTVKQKHGFLYSWIIMLAAIGIYQAALSVFLVFSGVVLIKKLINTPTSLKEFIQISWKLLLTFVVSLGIYAVIFKLYQKYKGIVDYQGLDQAGNIGLDVITKGIYNSYTFFVDFYFRGFISNFEVNLFEILNLILFVILAIALIKIMINSSIHLVNRVIILILIILMPIFGFVMFFVSPTVEYHMLMKFSLVFIYIAVVLFYSEYLEKKKKVVFSWITIIALLLSLGNNLVINNIAYLNAEIKYERSAALLNRVLVKAEELDNYSDAKKIMVIGTPKMWTKISSETVRNNIPWMTGAMGEHILISQSRIRNMTEYYLGIYLREVNYEQAENIKKSQEFTEMQVWPANDSVKVIEDVLVIRFN